MRERPILFSTTMVRAILEGRKTVTRRIIKESFNGCLTNGGCRQGKPGDHLWVRETFNKDSDGVSYWYNYKASWDDHALGEQIWKPSIFMPRKASRILLEVLSITVESLHDITKEDAIREGIGAGFQMNGGWPDYTRIVNGVCEVTQDDPRMSFATLWESINGVESWKQNPWVWRIEFKKLSK